MINQVYKKTHARNNKHHAQKASEQKKEKDISSHD
jgi:hypothetical protein